jgi:hypothetical protein
VPGSWNITFPSCIYAGKARNHRNPRNYRNPKNHRNPRGYARWSMFEKGIIFFQLISILFCDSFCRPLKNCSFAVNYLVYCEDQPIFYEVFSPQKNCRTGANILVLCSSKISMVWTKLSLCCILSRIRRRIVVRLRCWQKRRINGFTLANSQSCNQGCQMVYYQTKNPILGIFWRALE